MKACGIIIVKKKSNRFNNKNYHPVSGIPMFYHGVKLLQKNIKNDDIYVCTNSDSIIDYCKTKNIKTIERGVNVIRDDEPYFSVLKYAYQCINKKYDIIVSVLANSIEHDCFAIEKGLDIFKNDSHVSEIRSFDDMGNQSGIIMFRNSVFEKECMVLNHMAGIKSNGREIHYKDEL